VDSVTALVVVELPATDLRVDLAVVLDGILAALHGRTPAGVTVDVVTGPRADAVLAVLRGDR
jgi:hypothetical protein